MKVIMLSNQGRSMAVFWRVLIATMCKQGYEVIACVPYGDDSPATLGIPVLHYHLERKGLNPFKDLQSLRELYKIFAGQKPDIIFTTTIKPVIYGCLAAHWAKVPRIFATITGLGYAFEADTFFKKIINHVSRFLYKQSLCHASGIFFQNTDDARLFRECEIIAPNASVFFARGTGVDTTHFAKSPLPPCAPGAPVIFLLIGRLLEAKGIREYAEAAAILKQQFPNARFQLLGAPERGPGSLPKSDLTQFEQIEYLGETTDVRHFLANAHVAVLPSWREGTPTALMEAMSMGRPLVATDVPGCREVVRNGCNGFLAQVKNPQSLALAMRNFLENPDLIPSMGNASRDIAEKSFDAHVVASDILQNMARSLK